MKTKVRCWSLVLHSGEFVEKIDIWRVDGIIAVSWAQPRSPGVSLNQIGDTQPVWPSGETSRQLDGTRIGFNIRSHRKPLKNKLVQN